MKKALRLMTVRLLSKLGVFPFLTVTKVLLILGFVSGGLTASAQCTLICNNQVIVSLGPDCEELITYEMILEGEENANLCSPNGPGDFEVMVMTTPNGPTIPGSPYVTGDQAGQLLYVKVRHIPSGNFCVGSAWVQDYLPPVISCPADQVIACTDAQDPSMTGAATADDCSPVNITFSDQVTDFGCGDPQLRITRTWLATDAHNNTSTCTQVIDVSQPSLDEVVFPDDLNNFEAPALNCADADTSPSVTGRPALNGVPITGGAPCGLYAQYSDQVIPQCGGQYNILRTWTVSGNCTPGVRQETQIIMVKDNTGPVLVCPAPVAVGTNDPGTCSASIYLPPATVTDACSPPVTVIVQTPFGSLNSNGGYLGQVPAGNATATYIATDACGNESSCTVSLSVTDLTPPTVVCDDQLTVTLTSLGSAIVYAPAFEEGSSDDCCLASIEVKRTGAPDSAYGSFVQFNCDDIGAPVSVTLRALDCAGNANYCWSEVTVEDKTSPVILCPHDVTVTCEAAVTGAGDPVASDACGIAGVISFDEEFFNDCNTGYIQRTFIAEDNYGYTASCMQVITVIDTTPVVVTFPPDYTINDCTSIDDLEPDNLPAPYNYPQVEGDDCELTAQNWDDLVFVASGDACVKVLRTWTVIDWCTYDQAFGGEGLFQGTQILKIQDNQPPSFTCPADLSVPILGNGCTTTVTLPQLTDITDCLDDTEVVISGDLGSGYVHNDVGAGTYEVIYTVIDGCNNSSSCSFNVTVFDGKAPSIACLNGVSTALMPDGMIAVSAEAFAIVYNDNCTPQGDIELRLGPAPAPGQTTPPPGDQLIFDCDNLGTNIVAVWAGDAAGNWNYCETYILIDDNQDACIPMAMIAGNIHNELYDEVANVAVMLNQDSAYMKMTGADGQFVFDEMPMGQSYTIRPEKNINHSNGVSTMDIIKLQRHLLNVEHLDSPYKRIAADVNNSGTLSVMDLIALQRIILGIVDTFPNNHSWRFVDEYYVFPNPEDPFWEPWPEAVTLSSLDGNMLTANFMAVKVGDLDLSASNWSLAEPEERTQLAVYTPRQELSAGQTIRVPVRAGDFRQLLGFQLTFDFDPSALRFSGLIPGVLTGLDRHNLGERFLADGALTMSWAMPQEQDVAAGELLFELEFEALAAASLDEVLDISSRITPAEVYRREDRPEQLGLALVFTEATVDQITDGRVTAFPNPFRQSVTLSFDLPQAMPVQLTIYDALGRIVAVQECDCAAGRQQWLLETESWPASGYYIFQLQGNDFMARGKLVRR